MPPLPAAAPSLSFWTAWGHKHQVIGAPPHLRVSCSSMYFSWVTSDLRLLLMLWPVAEARHTGALSCPIGAVSPPSPQYPVLCGYTRTPFLCLAPECTRFEKSPELLPTLCSCLVLQLSQAKTWRTCLQTASLTICVAQAPEAFISQP